MGIGPNLSNLVTYHSHFDIYFVVYPYDKYLAVKVMFYNRKTKDKALRIEIWYPIVGYIWYSNFDNRRGSIIGPLYPFPKSKGGKQALLNPNEYIEMVLLADIPLEHAEVMKSIAEEEGIVQLYIHLQFSALYNQGTAVKKTQNYSPIAEFKIPKKVMEAWISQWSAIYNTRYEGLPQSVPEDVRHDYIEAVKCYNVGAYRAAVAMARRALQQAAEVKGAPKKDTLRNQIQWLFDQKLIDKATKNMADGVRRFGNYGAHPQDDLLSQVTKEDAELAIRTLRQILIKLWK